ncbi:saxitoxin and tetrodotoxin-binding protein 1-like [Cololabis saira]|uniref:saxitoxin and tetrodotoxin-binding protein 1-like n=1 Tax=Cololabis saira TaxID=129043 RepID=UPI002AD30CE6|nr:saxitoxin and tetrodotoxin-binding protein 1-like [Cololabis saira]
MEVLLRAALFGLMLLSSSVTFAAEECNIPPEVQRQDLHTLSEARWVLVEAFADNPVAVHFLKSANSSTVDLKLKDDNKTFTFIERNMLAGKECLIYRVNASISDPETSNYTFHMHDDGLTEIDGEVTPYENPGRANFHQGSPNCLIMNYSAVFMGKPGRVLLFYRSEGKPLDADELKAAKSKHRMVAECLNFNVDSSIRYDGKTELC